MQADHKFDKHLNTNWVDGFCLTVDNHNPHKYGITYYLLWYLFVCAIDE